MVGGQGLVQAALTAELDCRAQRAPIRGLDGDQTVPAVGLDELFLQETDQRFLHPQQFPGSDMRHDAEARYIFQDDRREVPESGDRAQEGEAAGQRPHLQQGTRLPLFGEGQTLHQGTHAALCVSV